jgi:hypothetical protein
VSFLKPDFKSEKVTQCRINLVSFWKMTHRRLRHLYKRITDIVVFPMTSVIFCKIAFWRDHSYYYEHWRGLVISWLTHWKKQNDRIVITTLREKPHYFSIILIIDPTKSILFFFSTLITTIYFSQNGMGICSITNVS